MSAKSRLTFIDDARGLAVLLMIFWHSVHGWIEPSLHDAHPRIWDAMRVFGGTAAPMFVALAGVGAAMKIAGDERRSRGRSQIALELFARGMHVVVIGYCLRVYAWTVDDRALMRTECLPSTIPLILGLAALLRGFEGLPDRVKRGLAWIAGGGALFALGVHMGFRIEPNKAIYFLKVDVLQAIGSSLALIALAYAALPAVTRALPAVLIGFALASATDPLLALTPHDLPRALHGYLGLVPAGGRPNLAAFPLLPWVGYAFAGLSLGRIWVPLARAEKGDLAVFGVGAIAACLGAITNGPTVHQFVLPHVPALYKGLFMLHKIGFGLMLLMVLTVFIRLAGRSPLTALGQTSMTIYWVHLEFTYGLLSKPVKRQLGYAEWAAAYVALVLLMALVAELRLRMPAVVEARMAALRKRFAPPGDGTQNGESR